LLDLMHALLRVRVVPVSLKEMKPRDPGGYKLAI
jgi:hypothetical protein